MNICLSLFLFNYKKSKKVQKSTITYRVDYTSRVIYIMFKSFIHLYLSILFHKYFNYCIIFVIKTKPNK